ncbi:MAG: glycerol-3-phosphate dehydrogenase subunit GlpB [Chloroflexi bacterium]|nr:glycerol-3-phosphate dehydrogenase subunit GlpB [Chloroflexota bacterium]
MNSMANDVLVIGAGLAGLTTAWQASRHGKGVRVIAKGWGATHWHAGCVDVLGYWPVDSETPATNPAATLPDLLAANPQHPYALVGLARLAAALGGLQHLCSDAGYPLVGSLDKNWRLPTAVGAARPTCLAPATMIAGDLDDDTPMLLVGFKQLPDFYAHLAADNLVQQGIPARHVVLDLPALAGRNFTTAVNLARFMQQSDFRAAVAQAVKPHLGKAARVGFPAVLGLEEATAVHQDLQVQLGRPVFEIPGLPPSVAGMRLHRILKAAIEKNGGQVHEGMEAIGFAADGGRVTAVHTETSGRPRQHRYEQIVLATGGILGGGIVTNHAGEVCEVVFNLPLRHPENRLEWFRRDFLDKQGHPIYRSGVSVNENFQPMDGRVLYQNLYAAGSTLAGFEAIRERSFDGVALATGYAVGNLVSN